MESPTKKSTKKPMQLIDDSKRSTSPDTVADDEVPEVEDIEALRKKFVGEVDLPESTCLSDVHAVHV